MPTTHYSTEPMVSVGIVSGEEIHFTLNGHYTLAQQPVEGSHTAIIANGLIHWNGKAYTELLFTPADMEASFTLEDVTIGVNFHWERKERQTFRGTLRLLANEGKILAINRLHVEQYLESVISSEMSATSNLPLLMAHAVISRSWLLAQMVKRSGGQTTPSAEPMMTATADRLVKWYDRQDHTLFDVCADDHCQRYQGITMETSANVAEAIRRTRGQILVYGEEICDARFSKCCGGAMEEFQYCWDDTPKPYLKAIGDTPSEAIPDLTIEANADKWIRTTPESFCNTHDKRILQQVLNDYDQETTDFYRWHVDYTQEQLSALIQKKTGIDFGQIVDLVPVERGKSGRLCLLKIVGSLRTMTIGKELEIRRALSESHLYSSAFVVDKEYAADNNTIPAAFHLIGAGWGHGVGLCQIGAAVMGDKGYSYDAILKHYYPGAALQAAW